MAQTRQKSEEPEDVGGTADRNGEKSSTGKRGGATGAPLRRLSPPFCESLRRGLVITSSGFGSSNKIPVPQLSLSLSPATGARFPS